MISTAALAAFLLHVLLGCCVHHAHAEQGGGDASAHRASHLEEHCGHHHEEGTDEQVPHAPGESCHHVDCVFDSVAKVELAKDTFTGLIPFLAPSALPTITATSIRPVTLALQTDEGPPLRPHLLHCVLLI
jgi:hypothetical protein